MLVGKGITYDTGGADIKAGGKKTISNPVLRDHAQIENVYLKL